MLIYPGNHRVSLSEEVTVNDIPLGYFSKVEKNETLSLKLEKEFDRNSKTRYVYPYKQYSHNNILFFDEDDNPITNSKKYLVKDGEGYYFNFLDAREFVPETFSYSVKLQKDDRYRSDISYRLTAAMYLVDKTDTDIANALAGVFNSSNGVNPGNVIVNDNDSRSISLINRSIKESDFLFIRKQNLTADIFSQCMDTHTNLWIIDDTDSLVKESDSQQCIYKDPVVYINNIYDIGDKIEIDQTKVDDYLSLFGLYNVGEELYEGMTPITLYSKPDEGFVIFSHISFINNLKNTACLMFEILMKIYLASFFESAPEIIYVADERIEYLNKPTLKFDSYHTRINLNDIFYRNGFNPAINYDKNSLEVITDNDERIKFLGLDKNNNILLRKIVKNDPVKENDELSIYTIKGTVINYPSENNVIKEIEDKLSISHKKEDSWNYIVIDRFRSSSRNINSQDKVTIIIPDNEENVLYYDYRLKSFQMKRSSVVLDEATTVKLATIKLDEDLDISCKDIRISGGGEVDGSENYEMIDTGCLEGRPYRIGSAMVIRLHETYKAYEKQIKKELDKHISSGDYYMLVFDKDR